MKMKNILTLLLTAVTAASLLLASGCSAREAKDIDPATAATSLVDTLTFKDTLIKAENGAETSFYKLDDTITSYAIYVSGSGSTAEEVAVLKVDSASDLKNAEDIVNKRVENLKFQFENYVPAEMVKLDDPVIVAQDNVVVLVLSDDSAVAKKAVDDLFK